MRVTRSVVWISTIDLVLFLVLWFLVSFRPSSVAHVTGLIDAVYWLTSFVGLIVGVFAFWVLTRGRSEDFRRSIISILLSLLPACVGLVALLSFIGTKPV